MINATHLRTALILPLLLSPMMFSATALAEEIRIPLGSQGEQESEIPARGMSSQQLLQRFGEPNHQQGPVGQPPISQWHYSNFVVYLEGDYVIHAVRKLKAKTTPSENS